MTVKGVLLDFNGTLFFDSKFHELAWKAISKELRGYEMSEEELRDHMHGKNNNKVIEYIMGKAIDDDENKRYSLKKEAMYRTMCMNHPQDFHLANGVEYFFDYLISHQIPFTIASASIKENIDFFVEKFHLDHWIDPSFIVYDNGQYPTKVEMFLEAARRIQVDIKDCLIVEDSVSGIAFAHACGVKNIIAIDSAHDKTKFEQFPFIKKILNDFSEFPFDIFG